MAIQILPSVSSAGSSGYPCTTSVLPTTPDRPTAIAPLTGDLKFVLRSVTAVGSSGTSALRLSIRLPAISVSGSASATATRLYVRLKPVSSVGSASAVVLRLAISLRAVSSAGSANATGLRLYVRLRAVSADGRATTNAKSINLFYTFAGVVASGQATATAGVFGNFYAFVAVVAAGLASTATLGLAGPAQPPLPPFIPQLRPTYVSKKPWTFWLASSIDVEPIGELKARNRSITWTMNKPGTLSCVVDMSHELAPLCQELQMSILAIRDGVVRWGGPIWTAEDDMENHQISINCMEWFERLNHRFIRPWDVKLGPTPAPGTLAADKNWNPDTDYAAAERGQIAKWMVDMVNAKFPTGITIGSVEVTPRIKWTYGMSSFKYVGAEISQLTEIEDGFDFRVDPQSRIMDIYAKMMVDRTNDVMFASGWGPDNLSSAHRSRDGSTLCNWMWVQGKSGPAALVGDLESDALVSQGAYGMFEEKVDLGEVYDLDVLLVHAGAEVLLRKDPRQIWTLTPRQYVEGGSVPRIFDDYDIGDLVSLMVRKGTVQMAQPTAVRLFGATIAIDEEGNEKISQLQTTPQ